MVWLLVLLWLAFGLLAGALSNAARWGLGAHSLGGRYAVWATLGIGGGGALVGGALGWLILGRFFATPTALWVAMLTAGAGPWLAARLRDWKREMAARESER
jgi:hypothetical protein